MFLFSRLIRVKTDPNLAKNYAFLYVAIPTGNIKSIVSVYMYNYYVMAVLLVAIKENQRNHHKRYRKLERFMCNN